ncbi:MAG: acyl-CoA dehydrogenase family protein [Georgfuchsia sp.]
MDLDFTQAEKQFREQVTTWLHDNVPKGPRPYEGDEALAFDIGWQRKMHDAGWAGIAWPTEYGGRGLSTMQQLIWFEEYAKAGGPWAGHIIPGMNMAGPTLIVEGNAEQKAFHLPKILRAEVTWCQGFSEPSAGSDLASLHTRAVIDGDHLVVNGQKIWTSFGNYADYQMLLVRTDPDVPKHKGISWLICDMKTPGITIRPIEIMSGGHHFCEVFYDDVRIPLSNVVGKINDGWRVSMSTLSFERGTAFMADCIELEKKIEKLIRLARTQPSQFGNGKAIDDDEIRRRLGQANAESSALRSIILSAISRIERTGKPGPESSIIRLHYSLQHQRVYRLALDILGPAQTIMSEPGQDWTQPYLRSYASTIAGGTAQVQRNIIGERILGLPK